MWHSNRRCISILYIIFIFDCLKSYGFGFTRLDSKAVFRQYASRILAMQSVEEIICVHKGLTAQQFAHPRDLKISSALSNLPLAHTIARSLLRSRSGSPEHDGCIQVDHDHQLYKLLQMASKTLDMEAPELFVKECAVPNAFTLSHVDRTPKIVLHSSLLEILGEEELLAIVAHELGHIKCKHDLWALLLANISRVADWVVRGHLPLRHLLEMWHQSAEYSSDRAALLVVQDDSIVLSALAKLAGMESSGAPLSSHHAEDFPCPDGFDTSTWQFCMNEGVGFHSHPNPVDRVQQIRSWARSKQFYQLVACSSLMPISIS